jgi:hypothetical protein
MLRLYQAALQEAVRLSGVPAHLLEAAVARDFGEWGQTLPKPPKAS